MDKIQPTMQKTVTRLRHLGYRTTDSGDGAIDIEAGMACALQFPHVFTIVDSERMKAETGRLWDALVARCPTVPGEDDIRVETMYASKDGKAFLGLYGITDVVLARLSVVS